MNLAYFSGLFLFCSITACSGDKGGGPGPSSDDSGTSAGGDTGADSADTGGDTSDTGDGGQHGPPHFEGAFVLGERTEGWTCLNYFGADGDYLDLWAQCPTCDYGFTITSEYIPDALSDYYPECEWTDLPIWTRGEEFTASFGFNFEDAVVYYPYADSWYPLTELIMGTAEGGMDYLAWTFLSVPDDGGGADVGYFWGYVGTAY